jgi:hypothetical protein
VWLFNHTGGSAMLTIVFHVAQGTFSYPCRLRRSRRRPDGWLVGVLWFALVLVLLVADRRLALGAAIGGRAASPACGRLTCVVTEPVGPFSGACPVPARSRPHTSTEAP